MCLRVAVYCRVSTDKEDQINSFESQKRYFAEIIGRRTEWELCGIYADEGVSGTSTAKRREFNRMMEDARAGRFDRIITKEVSRFARNTVDALTFTRELRGRGIGVEFVNDGINTLEPDAELRLAIMGSIAQEESRKTSSRVKWGQTRRMEQGVVFGRSLLGYDVKDGQLTINQEGARIVRKIYQWYVFGGMSSAGIAKRLTEEGIRTARGNREWNSGVVIKILKNEKYCGDLLQKKTVTPDYLTHQKRINRGQEAMVYLRDHHEPVIDRELWERARERMCRSRSGKKT
ncbi:MAG: recombinase family protein [Lachnospiraceae bacterium]|nr:recombinase family protein [Lachnospiraceae bacterium]